MSLINEKKFKIIALYVTGFLLMAFYYWIDGSTEIERILDSSEYRGADAKFGMYAIIGIIKYGSIVSGGLIIGITTLKLSRMVIESKA